MITIYLIISLILSLKYRGLTFAESTAGYAKDARRRADSPSFTYAIGDNGKKEKVPATREVSEWRVLYDSVYDSLLEACRNAKGKHGSDGRLHGDAFTSLIKKELEYRAVIIDIQIAECGLQKYQGKHVFNNEHFIISDDKDYIFKIFNAGYQALRALKKDKRYACYASHKPTFGVNTYGLYKRFTDVERFMLENGFNPAFVYMLNRITYPFIKKMQEPFPLADRDDHLYDHLPDSLSGQYIKDISETNNEKNKKKKCRKESTIMLINLTRDLIEQKQLEEAYAFVYGKTESGDTLTEVLQKAASAARMLKKAEYQEIPYLDYRFLGLNMKQEYMHIPRMCDDSYLRFVFRLTHPSYTFVDEEGNELDIRDVMKMNFHRIRIAPRTPEIAEMWESYRSAYEDFEKKIENAIYKLRSREDISQEERRQLNDAIDNYNEVYSSISQKEEGSYGYIIRDRREFQAMIFRAYYLGGILKSEAYTRLVKKNISEIASKSTSKYKDEMIELYIYCFSDTPRILTESERNALMETVNHIAHGKFGSDLRDPKYLFDESRRSLMAKLQKDYECGKYIFLDEDRMGLYRMILETDLSKEEIWARLGYETNGGILGSEEEYICH